MNHNITAENFGVRLRPVTMEDARYIYKLRRSPKLAQYIGEFDDRFSVHLNWLENYFRRPNDYYFIIELLQGRRLGTIALYNLEESTANWGRWIIEPPFPAAPASAWLIYHVAFNILQLSSVYSNTVLENSHIVSFHDSCGLKRTKIEPAGLTIRNVAYDMIIHTAYQQDWPNLQQKLAAPAKLAERLFQESGSSVKLQSPET